MSSIKYGVYLWRRNFLNWKSLGFIPLYINLHVAYLHRFKSYCLYVLQYNFWFPYIIHVKGMHNDPY